MNPVNTTAVAIARTDTVPPSHSATRSTFFCDEAKRRSHAAHGLSRFMSRPFGRMQHRQPSLSFMGWRAILKERARRPVSRWANRATARRNRCFSATKRNAVASSYQALPSVCTSTSHCRMRCCAFSSPIPRAESRSTKCGASSPGSRPK
jgi:hypothetical protein